LLLPPDVLDALAVGAPPDPLEEAVELLPTPLDALDALETLEAFELDEPLPDELELIAELEPTAPPKPVPEDAVELEAIVVTGGLPPRPVSQRQAPSPEPSSLQTWKPTKPPGQGQLEGMPAVHGLALEPEPHEAATVTATTATRLPRTSRSFAVMRPGR
jgi:hypothetical protein